MLGSFDAAISEQGAGSDEINGALQRARLRPENPATALVVGVDRLFRETLKLFLEVDGFTAIEARSLDDLRDRMPPDGGHSSVTVVSLYRALTNAGGSGASMSGNSAAVLPGPGRPRTLKAIAT